MAAGRVRPGYGIQDHRTTAVYHYNAEGNLIRREVNGQNWQYRRPEAVC